MPNPTLISFSESDPANVGVASGAGRTTASLTWQTGDVLVCAAVMEGITAGDTLNAPSNTGSGLAWTQRQLHAAASDCPAAAWTAVATANGSGTVTVTQTIAGASGRLAVAVYQYRAPSGYVISVGNSTLGTGKTTSPQQVALTISSPDSSVVWVASDWSAAASETVSPTATAHSAASPGPTASPFASGPVGTSYSFYFDELDDQVSTGSVNFGYSGASAGPFTIVAVEVKIASSVAPAFIPRAMPGGV